MASFDEIAARLVARPPFWCRFVAVGSTAAIILIRRDRFGKQRNLRRVPEKEHAETFPRDGRRETARRFEGRPNRDARTLVYGRTTAENEDVGSNANKKSILLKFRLARFSRASIVRSALPRPVGSGTPGAHHFGVFRRFLAGRSVFSMKPTWMFVEISTNTRSSAAWP